MVFGLSCYPTRLQESEMSPPGPKKKQPANVSRKPKRSMRSQALSTVSNRLLDTSLRRKGFVHTRIVRDWPRIAGDELARVTVPLRVVFPRGQRSGATLYLRCTSAFAPLAQHQAPRIIADVNRFFGYPAIETLIIKQGPVKTEPKRQGPQSRDLTQEETTKLDTLVSGGDSDADGLKAALKRLGKAVLSQK